MGDERHPLPEMVDPYRLQRMTTSTSHRGFREQALHYFIRPHTAPPTNPISSPAAWHGKDMRTRESEWRVALTDLELSEFDEALDRLERDGVPLEKIDRARIPLPSLATKFAAWRDELDVGRGFVVVSGLPVSEWGEERSARAFWAIGHHLGVPGAQNPQNELIGHVKDYGEQANSPEVRLYRPTSNIDFHCDAADVVGLLCLQTARKGWPKSHREFDRNLECALRARSRDRQTPLRALCTRPTRRTFTRSAGTPRHAAVLLR